MAAACKAAELNPSLKILLAERETQLGGVLTQCVHRGFGMGYFGENLTGVEYAERWKVSVAQHGISVRLSTEVICLNHEKKAWLSGERGYEQISFDALILAAGCREKSIGGLAIQGTRPAGVFLAGQLQKMMNLGNYDPGNEAVILGSGDIGLIMARQLYLSGKKVHCVLEREAESHALERNKMQCLEAIGIPLYLNETIVCLHGAGRLSGVTVRNLLTGKEKKIACDILVAAVGLIPERQLIRELIKDENNTVPNWVYLCGNCEHVHPIVDGVSYHAEKIAVKVVSDLV